MPLRFIKKLNIKNTIKTALYWSDLGLICGDITGHIYIWKKDDSQKGGLSHLSSDAQDFPAHKMAVSSLTSIGTNIISISLDGTIFVSNVETKEVKQILSNLYMPFCISCNESTQQILIGTLDGKVHLIDALNFTIQKTETVFQTEIQAIAIHPQTNKGCALTKREIALFDLDSLNVTKKLTITADCCDSLTFSSDGFSILVTTAEGTLRVVDSISFKEVGCQKYDDGELNDICPINFGKSYVIAGSAGKLCLFNLTKMSKETGLQIDKDGFIKCVATQPGMNDATIAVACGCSITLVTSV